MKQTLHKFYMEIYNEEKSHVSEISGLPLPRPSDSKFTWSFLHVLPHGSYPSFKFDRRNILRATPDEHDNQEFIPYFRKRYEELKRLYYQEIYNKKFE